MYPPGPARTVIFDKVWLVGGGLGLWVCLETSKLSFGEGFSAFGTVNFFLSGIFDLRIFENLGWSAVVWGSGRVNKPLNFRLVKVSAHSVR